MQQQLTPNFKALGLTGALLLLALFAASLAWTRPAQASDAPPRGIQLSINRSTNSPLYSNETHLGRINLDATGLTPAPLKGAYLEMKVDATWLAKIAVSSADIIAGTTQTDNGDGTRTVRIELSTLDPTVNASFPYSVTFKPSLTPEDYVFNPDVKLYTSDGTLITTATGSAPMSVKYDAPVITKYAGSNTLEDFSRDGNQLYGGTASGSHVADPANVTFMYRLSTDTPRNPSSYPNGRYKFRQHEQIVITDTLPTYTNSAGQQVHATFVAANNPGWTDNGNGTVSYVVSNASENLFAGADQDVSKVALKLQFPDAPTGVKQTNTVSARLTPLRKGAQETERTATDSLVFTLTDDPFQGKKNSVLTKNSNTAFKFNMDLGANWTSFDQYWVTVKNATAYPLRNVVVVDQKFDPRCYLYSINIPDRSHVTQVLGIQQDGSEVEVSVANGAVFDQRAYDSVQEQVARVRAGALDAADTVPATQQFKGFKIVLDPAYAIPPGSQFQVLVALRLNDPFHTKPVADKAANTYRNTADATGSLLTDPAHPIDFDLSSTSSSSAVARAESVAITKTTNRNTNTTGKIGENVQFDVTVNTAALSKGRLLKGVTVVDVLPYGMTSPKTGSWNWNPAVNALIDSIETIDNYHGSQRQALLIHLKDLGTDDNPIPDAITLNLTQIAITDQMIPTEFETSENNNDNHVYLTVDGWDPLPDNVASQTLVTDTHDVDGDGSTTDKILGASSSVLVTLPYEVRSRKLIGTDGTSFGAEAVDVPFGGTFFYRLESRNYGRADLPQFELVDTLPAFDKGAGRVQLTGPLTAPDPFEVSYRTASVDGLDTMQVAQDAAAWKSAADITDWSQVQAVRIRLKQGALFTKGSVMRVDMPVRAPTFRSSAHNGAHATNSFWRSVDGGTTYGESNPVDVYLMAHVTVTKRWEGPAKDQAVIELYDEADPQRTVGSAALTERDGWSHTFDVPAYTDASHTKKVVYRVREQPIADYTVSVSGDVPTGFTVTNTYDPLPPHTPATNVDSSGLAAAAPILFAAAAAPLATYAFLRRR